MSVGIIHIKDNKFEVKSISGNTHLGGEDFDNRLVSHFVQECRRKLKKDISSNKKSMRKLKNACENAKKTLTTCADASIVLESLLDYQDFHSKLSLSRFEELNLDLFEKVVSSVESAIRTAAISQSKIDHVLLVGGSSRIPKLHALLKEFFNWKTLNKNLNSDEAVVSGAAIWGASLSSAELKHNVVIQESIPFSLGIEGARGVMDTFLKRNTSYPTRASKILKFPGNLPHIPIKVFEGERAMCKDNTHLATFQVSLSPTPGEKCFLEVVLQVSKSGIMDVSVLNVETKSPYKVDLIEDKTGFIREDIESLLKIASKYEITSKSSS